MSCLISCGLEATVEWHSLCVCVFVFVFFGLVGGGESVVGFLGFLGKCKHHPASV